MSFSDVVEAIKLLAIKEKQEIQLLIRHYLREEQREEFYHRFKLSQAEAHKRELKFSCGINQLKQSTSFD